ncbi:MAG TPA: OmpA family protein [Vicinamibacteria bacterium]|nr:OmpA family protein [Vicinamibacteria bacterium]
MKRETRLLQAGLMLAALGIAGCASWGKQEQGAVIGAAGGAVVGGAVGHVTGSTARGAIIGAVVGGAAGAIIGGRMDRQAEELARELPPGTQVSRVGEGIAVTFEDGILFPFDSASLKPEARDNLREVAQSLRDNARTDVVIVGHTDSTGRAEYNESLSQRRARAAADFLAAEGVARGRLRTEGRGESEPIASNETEADRQRNRRVELAIYANEEWREEARREAASR